MIMKKITKKAAPETKEETPALLPYTASYKADLEEIKDLLKVIVEKLNDIRPLGGGF
jgi:hypothetical protein